MIPFLPVELPVGAILPYAGPINPCTQKLLCMQGWLFCDGSVYRQVDYPELFAVIRQLHGFPSGDANSGLFCVPDCRGMFLRGVNFGATIQRGDSTGLRDPDASARTAAGPEANGNAGDAVGSVELDAFQGHEHGYSHMELTSTLPPGTDPTIPAPASVDATTTSIAKDSGDGTPRYGPETRPLNLSVHFLIKARSQVSALPLRRAERWCVNTKDQPTRPGTYCECSRLPGPSK